MGMNEIIMNCNLQSPQEAGTAIEVTVEKNVDEELVYKFSIGEDGKWTTLRDFQNENSFQWVPEADGKYIIMVQAKEKNSTKPFDHATKINYVIGSVEEKLIEAISLDKDEYSVGDRIRANVVARQEGIMYRYWMKQGDNWELVRDYGVDNFLGMTVKIPGSVELLVECKKVASLNDFDDFSSVKFNVKPVKALEITSFDCLSTELTAGSELIFQVDVSCDDSRTTLYKFLKINGNGSVQCVQDYSTKRMASFVENDTGSFRLLCLAKDMYSPREYDDRAIINYKVKPYEDIRIASFTTDVNSPQTCGTNVTLKAVVKGGKNLLYRYVIDGNYGEDSGYVRTSTFVWNAKYQGEYRIRLMVRDESFDGTAEAESQLNFVIDEKSLEPVTIKNMILDKNTTNLLKNDTVNITVEAGGGCNLKYSFTVRKDEKTIEKVEYGNCNWVNFTPEESGHYEMEARVKDKYSNREYDAHAVICFDAFEYLPANIDYVLVNTTEHYLVGDTIALTTIFQNTKNVVVDYVLKINGQKVEETGFVSSAKYAFTPKYAGVYCIEITARNVKSDKAYDCKREVKVAVHEAMPVSNTIIKCNSTKLVKDQGATFTVECDGGKGVMYEFYVMEQDEWRLAQRYSRKDYFGFMPFRSGIYKILALVKSEHLKVSYEDYAMVQFYVE